MQVYRYTCVAVSRCMSGGLRHIAGYSLKLIKQVSWELCCRVYPCVMDDFQCRLWVLLHTKAAREQLWHAAAGAEVGSFSKKCWWRQCRELGDGFLGTPLPTVRRDLT